jgi:UDP-glucose 4-epimerase
MKVVITGSNGFIGSGLSTYLNSQGYCVLGIDRPNTFNQLSQSNHPGFTFLPLDIPNPLLEDWMNIWRPDFLIHAAGTSSVPLSVSNPLGDFTGSVQLFYYILDTIRRSAPNCKVIFLSSAAVYGNPNHLPVCEDDSVNPVSPYGYNKYLCEKTAELFHRIYHLNICMVRIFSAYGPGLRRQVLWDVCNKAVRDPVVNLIGTGQETRDFIYIDDIVRAIHNLLEKAIFRAETYNLASGIEISINELTRLIIQLMGTSKEIKYSGVGRTGDPIKWRANINKLCGTGYFPKVTLQEGVRNYVGWAKETIRK